MWCWIVGRGHDEWATMRDNINTSVGESWYESFHISPSPYLCLCVGGNEMGAYYAVYQCCYCACFHYELQLPGPSLTPATGGYLSSAHLQVCSCSFLCFNALKNDEDLQILNTHLQISGLTLDLELIHIYRSVDTQLSTHIWEELCYNNGPMRTHCKVLCVQLFHFQYNNKSAEGAPHPKIKT